MQVMRSASVTIRAHSQLPLLPYPFQLGKPFKPFFSIIRPQYSLESQSYRSDLRRIQVTFLNKISIISLDLQRLQKIENEPSAVIKMLVHFFHIKTSLVKSAHLIKVKSKETVASSSQLQDGAAYYLAFTRFGQSGLVPSKFYLQQEFPDPLRAWDNRDFFFRDSHKYQIKPQETKHFEYGTVELLKLNQSTPSRQKLSCPFAHCGRLFKHATDLETHFLFETGKKPFQCGICGKQFRRKVVLKKHMSHSHSIQGTISIKQDIITATQGGERITVKQEAQDETKEDAYTLTNQPSSNSLQQQSVSHSLLTSATGE